MYHETLYQCVNNPDNDQVGMNGGEMTWRLHFITYLAVDEANSQQSESDFCCKYISVLVARFPFLSFFFFLSAFGTAVF